MRYLDPEIIKQTYTLAQIEAQILILQDVYNNALKNKSYSLDDMEARQRVEQHDIDKVGAELAVWLKAKALSIGSSQTKLLTIKYTGNNS